MRRAPELRVQTLCWRMKPGIERIQFVVLATLAGRAWQVPLLLPGHLPTELPGAKGFLCVMGFSRDLATMLPRRHPQALELFRTQP